MKPKQASYFVKTKTSYREWSKNAPVVVFGMDRNNVDSVRKSKRKALKPRF